MILTRFPLNKNRIEDFILTSTDGFMIFKKRK